MRANVTRCSGREEALIPLEKTAARSLGDRSNLPTWLPLIVLAALAFRLRTLLPA
jgi:hypothetical protein